MPQPPRNSLRARLEFSFKGETHSLETTIDLDACVADTGDVPDFHRILARAGGIDPISYLYEVMETYDLEFDAPTGLAAACFDDGAFDWYRFSQLQRDERDLQSIESIAVQYLAHTEFAARDDLRQALLAVFRAGQSAGGN